MKRSEIEAALANRSAAELAALAGISLGRGRPSAVKRAALTAKVLDAKAAGKVKLSKGSLVRGDISVAL